MTIEEFMRDIAPKMRPGWIAMDETDSFLFGSIIELFLEFIILGFIESF